jgi:signal transduction histidine kinase
MKSKISREFLLNYCIVFLLSIVAAVFAFILLAFADSILSRTLMKNTYPAKLLMKDNYRDIDTAPVIQNGGGVQVINGDYRVVYSEGLDIIGKKQLSAGEFTEFLVNSKAKGIPYHVDVLYNENQNFWLVVTFPTSIRLDLSLVYNREAVSRDLKPVAAAFLAVLLLYLLLLFVFAMLFSKLTSARITSALKKLCKGTERLREGDYSARVDLGLKNEFKELEDLFNTMAEKVEQETFLRKQAEDDRKRMILDVSHDLKNPLASVAGYAELCLKKGESLDEDTRGYLEIINKNSRRAADLLNQLFALSLLDSPRFALKTVRTNVCEYLRQVCGEILPMLEKAGFNYDFDIPEQAVYAMIDPMQMSRVFYNLADNAVRYNAKGTMVSVRLTMESDRIVILFTDNGVGIPSQLTDDIFRPFVRVDNSRNSETGGSGLGLSIAHKVIQAHGGSLTLKTDVTRGCEFKIVLPSASRTAL